MGTVYIYIYLYMAVFFRLVDTKKKQNKRAAISEKCTRVVRRQQDRDMVPQQDLNVEREGVSERGGRNARLWLTER